MAGKISRVHYQTSLRNELAVLFPAAQEVKGISKRHVTQHFVRAIVGDIDRGIHLNILVNTPDKSDCG